jgi:hypothetical protein
MFADSAASAHSPQNPGRRPTMHAYAQLRRATNLLIDQLVKRRAAAQLHSVPADVLWIVVKARSVDTPDVPSDSVMVGAPLVPVQAPSRHRRKLEHQ